MKIKEVYDRIGIQKAPESILKHLLNQSDVLTLVEFWDGGPMEGHLLIQKSMDTYYIYEIIYRFGSNKETVQRFELKNVNTIDSIAKEIQRFFEVKYDGAVCFDFSKIKQDKDVCAFLGF